MDLVIYALNGREVWRYRAEAGSPGGAAGANTVVWDGRNGDGNVVLDGVYVARIEGGGLDASVKIAVVK